MIHYFIPIIAAILFRCGGTDQWPWCILNQKLWRWLMGVVIGLMLWKGWFAYGICIVAYLLATNLFGYGEKTPILKYLPKWAKFFMSGFMFGLASMSLVGPIYGLIQAIVGGLSFYVLMLLDDAEIVKNPYQELLRGGLGTILFLFV